MAHGFVSVASRRTGKPLWWVDNNGFANATTPVIGAAIVYLSMLVVFVIALRRARIAPAVSASVAVALAASAALDLSASPGSASVVLGAAAAAFLASIAALAGRTVRH